MSLAGLTRQPAERICDCGEVLAPYWDARSNCWRPPPRTCRTCREREAIAAEENRVRESIRAAGIPERYQGWSFDRNTSPVVWEKLDGVVHDAVKHREFVLWEGNFGAAEIMRGWRPEDGSVYLYGPAGSGKTQLLMMAACRLLSEPMRMVEAPIASETRDGYPPRLRRVGGVSVVVSSEKDLASAIRRRRAGYGDPQTEAHPMDAPKRCGVLVLDDLGSADDKAAPDLVEELVDARYKAGRPILASSNYSLDEREIRARLGERTCSRLTEMAGPRMWPVHGSFRAVLGSERI
jgi:DNA replication protein DnaC